jgi:hypothetical protein
MILIGDGSWTDEVSKMSRRPSRTRKYPVKALLSGLFCGQWFLLILLRELGWHAVYGQTSVGRPILVVSDRPIILVTNALRGRSIIVTRSNTMTNRTQVR